MRSSQRSARALAVQPGVSVLSHGLSRCEAFLTAGRHASFAVTLRPKTSLKLGSDARVGDQRGAPSSLDKRGLSRGLQRQERSHSIRVRIDPTDSILLPLIRAMPLLSATPIVITASMREAWGTELGRCSAQRAE